MKDSIQASASHAKPSPEQFDVCHGCSEKIDTLIHFAVLLEREACAKIAETADEGLSCHATPMETSNHIADCIRARGE